MILILLFSLSEMVGVLQFVCVSDKFLLKGVCDKSSSNDEMPHGVCRWFTFPGDFCERVCACMCVALTWCKVDGLLVKAAFLLPSCYQEEAQVVVILWPHPKTCPKVIFYFNINYSVSLPCLSCLHLCVCSVLRASLFCFGEGSLRPCLKVKRGRSGGENIILEFQVVCYSFFWHKRYYCMFQLSSDLLVLCKLLALYWRSRLSGGNSFHVVFLYMQLYVFYLNTSTPGNLPLAVLFQQIFEIRSCPGNYSTDFFITQSSCL